MAIVLRTMSTNLALFHHKAWQFLQGAMTALLVSSLSVSSHCFLWKRCLFFLWQSIFLFGGFTYIYIYRHAYPYDSIWSSWYHMYLYINTKINKNTDTLYISICHLNQKTPASVRSLSVRLLGFATQRQNQHLRLLPIPAAPPWTWGGNSQSHPSYKMCEKKVPTWKLKPAYWRLLDEDARNIHMSRCERKAIHVNQCCKYTPFPLAARKAAGCFFTKRLHVFRIGLRPIYFQERVVT